ncbi:MAG: LacI family transcriptional regulator [Bacteroidetes bacterium]|nr:LacI family transcriptional regulator [Bacteroidota bacterium]
MKRATIARRPQNTQIRRRSTIKDIAQALSVTPATVSKALRDGSDISKETKEKVRKLSQKLGYRPSLLARSLINRRSKIIGVLVPDLRISFFSEAVKGMYEEASRKGYQCVFLVHDELEAREREKLEFLYDIQVDGILLNAAGGKANYPFLEKMSQEGTRFVCWDRSIGDFSFRSVKIDDFEASYKLTSKIIHEGRKRIMFLGPHSGVSVLRDRFKGYRSALKENAVPYRPELVVQSFRNVEDSYNKVVEILRQKVHFDAIVSIGGLITYGAGKAILESSKRVPEDVMIGEFGDNDIVYKLGVPFYSVVQNPQEMGKASTDLLINMIETRKSDEEFSNVVIDSEIVERRPLGK